MKPVESYEEILSIGFFTAPQAVIWRGQWLQSIESNDFDADW
jgi:hypothetical protein